MKVQVYTDGACSKNGQKHAKASYAYWIPDHSHLSGADRVPEGDPQTNNRGELLAIMEGVKKVATTFNPNEIDLVLYTDSMYSKNCLTTWLPGWISRGWKTSNNTDVLNRDIIENTSAFLVKFKSYIISYVAAHTGKDDEMSRNNHIVDRMAARVLNPSLEDEVKHITSNTEKPTSDFPIELMGPPVSEKTLIDWCYANLDKLDKKALDSALLSALQKTVKEKGFVIDKQRIHKSTMYRMITSNHLIAGGATIFKEDE